MSDPGRTERLDERRKSARSRRRRAVLTILAIVGTLAGTLVGCGRYGRPVRPPVETNPANTARTADTGTGAESIVPVPAFTN